MTPQTENQSPRNEAELRERAMQHNRRYPSHPSAPLVSDLLALLAEKDKVDGQWSKTTPDTTGEWWFCPEKWGSPRIVRVAGPTKRMDGTAVLYTNEDGGAGVDDPELYSNGWWMKASERPMPARPEAALAAREQSEGGG